MASMLALATSRARVAGIIDNAIFPVQIDFKRFQAGVDAVFIQCHEIIVFHQNLIFEWVSCLVQ
jgi:hypothetical protein